MRVLPGYGVRGRTRGGRAAHAAFPHLAHVPHVPLPAQYPTSRASRAVPRLARFPRSAPPRATREVKEF